jgi:hypothetical protein
MVEAASGGAWGRPSPCYHTDRNRKLLLDTEKIGRSDFVNFNDSQGCHRHSTRELLIWPSDAWTEDRHEPRQSKGLKRRIIDLIYEKKEK